MSAPGVRTRRAATAAAAGPRVARLTLGRVLRRPEEDDMAPFREARRALEARASALGCVHQLERGEEHKSSYNEIDPRFVVSLDVWEGLEPVQGLKASAEYAHFQAHRDRWLWRAEIGTQDEVLFYVPDGHTPTVEEGLSKLEELQANGPSAEVFSLVDRSLPRA